MASVEVHPEDAGIPTVVAHRKVKGADGTVSFERHRLHAIDAREAAKAHPQEWRLSPWPHEPADEAVIDNMEIPPAAQPELLEPDEMPLDPPPAKGHAVAGIDKIYRER